MQKGCYIFHETLSDFVLIFLGLYKNIQLQGLITGYFSLASSLQFLYNHPSGDELSSSLYLYLNVLRYS